MKKKIRAVCGGTSASKTISILLYLIALSQTDKTPKLASVISESTPHLKRGAIRDFKNIMHTHGYWVDSRWNATDSIYTFETGSQIEFFSADQPEKLRGGRRDRGFMNECNNLTLEQFDEFEVRTRDFVFLDWNPTSEFWFYEDVQGKREDVEFITLTYKDNEALDSDTVKSIEARKNRKNWWRVYGLGLLGEVEGRIYKGWKVIDEIPVEAKLVRFGLDFGYSNDPTAIVAVYKYNDSFIVDEIAYRTGLKNNNIASLILGEEEPDIMTIADSSEPKSIDEIKDRGVLILGAKKQKKDELGKGQSYLNWSIGLVQGQSILLTKRSINVLKEYRNYMWRQDNDGKWLNVPEDMFNHCMDALRYALVDILAKQDRKPVSQYKPGTKKKSVVSQFRKVMV